MVYQFFSIFNFPNYIYSIKTSPLPLTASVWLAVLISWLRVLIVVFSMTKQPNKSTRGSSALYWVFGMSHLILGNLLYIPIVNLLSSPLACAREGGAYVSYFNSSSSCILSSGIQFQSYASLASLIAFSAVTVL